MATSRPISTISYNTKDFLLSKLNTWYKSHLIQAYQVIFHVGEEGDKNHAHVRIEPNKVLDPMNLTAELKEPDPHHNLPLGCRPWRPSDEANWCLYVVHDEEYLKFKYNGGEKGEKLPYKWQDIIASEYYDIETMFIRAKISFNHNSQCIAQRLASGDTPMSLILDGESPSQVNQINNALYHSDYAKLRNEYKKLENELNAYKNAAEKFGVFLCFDESGIAYFEEFNNVIPFV